MSRMTLGLFLATGIFAAGLLQADDAMPPEPLPEKQREALFRQSRAIVEQRRILDALIKEIGEESYDKLVENLFVKEQYFDPGYQSPKHGEQAQLLRVLSTRRVLRVLKILGQKPDVERRNATRELFEKAFQKHRKTFAAIVAMHTTPGAAKNTTSLAATLHAMEVSLLASAEGRDLGDLCTRLDALKAWQEIPQPGLDEVPEPVRVVLGMNAVPDPRFRLNVLLTCLENRGDPACEFLAELQPEIVQKVLTIVPWNARVTPFDRLHRIHGMPIDETLGTATKLTWDWPGHLYWNVEAQELLITELREEFVGE